MYILTGNAGRFKSLVMQPRYEIPWDIPEIWFPRRNRLRTARLLQPRKTMTDLDPHTRIYFTPPPFLRGFGCAGCLLVIFVIGGIVGVLLFGWRTLLGY